MTQLESSARNGRVVSLPVTAIQPNPFQPRKRFSEEELAELTESIRENGVLQPVVARQVGEDRYELVMGERRLRAAQRAGLTEIPGKIGEFTDEQMETLGLVENLQRSDLTLMEEAYGAAKLVERHGAGGTAKKLSKSVIWVQDRTALLQLPLEIREMLDEKTLNMSHAKVLLGVKSPEAQIKAARLAKRCALTATQLRARTQNEQKEEQSQYQKAARPQTLSCTVVALTADIQTFDPSDAPVAFRRALSIQLQILNDAVQRLRRKLDEGTASKLSDSG